MATTKAPSTHKSTKPSAVLSEADKKKIVSSVASLNLAEHPKWWGELDQLSSNTEFDGVEVFEDEIVAEPGGAKKFRGNANVYVKLVYGGKHDETEMSESFPIAYTGHLEGSKAIIDDVIVDISSFQGEEK